MTVLLWVCIVLVCMEGSALVCLALCNIIVFISWIIWHCIYRETTHESFHPKTGQLRVDYRMWSDTCEMRSLIGLTLLKDHTPTALHIVLQLISGKGTLGTCKSEENLITYSKVNPIVSWSAYKGRTTEPNCMRSYYTGWGTYLIIWRDCDNCCNFRRSSGSHWQTMNAKRNGAFKK